jgi:hypothetical protein
MKLIADIGKKRDFQLNSVIVLSIFISQLHPQAFSKTQAKPLQGLVQEQPTFDLSSTKLTFQLGAQHNEFRRSARKPLLHAEDSLGLLKGGAKTFQLSASANGGNLRSESAKNGTLLQGAVDKSSKPLEGKAIVDPRSPLTTIERFNSPFQLALDKLPELAPDLSFQMDEQLQRAQSQAQGDLSRREQLMDSKLRASKPHSDIPEIPARTMPTVSLSKVMDSELQKTQKSKRTKNGAGDAPFKLAMMPGQPSPVKGAMPDSGSGNLPQMKSPGFPQSNDITEKVKRSEIEMEAQLANAHRVAAQFPSQTNPNSPDTNSRMQINDLRPNPGIDAVLTQVRSLPVASFPSLPKSNAPGDMSDVVPWDEWHARFAQIARGPILTNVSNAKHSSGADTVEITVWRNLRVDAKLTKPGSAEFDRAILNAYKSLSGNPGLSFPQHSRREKITFQVDNEHHGAGIPSSVQSQTKKGDKEIIQHHI